MLQEEQDAAEKWWTLQGCLFSVLFLFFSLNTIVKLKNQNPAMLELKWPLIIWFSYFIAQETEDLRCYAISWAICSY